MKMVRSSSGEIAAYEKGQFVELAFWGRKKEFSFCVGIKKDEHPYDSYKRVLDIATLIGFEVLGTCVEFAETYVSLLKKIRKENK